MASERGARLRLFVAVTPPRAHLQWLHDETAALRARLTSARWTPVDNQHVTLKFLGAVDEARLDEVTAVVTEAATWRGPESCRLEGLGSFPSPRRTRVLWAGIEDPAELLTGLAAGIEAAFAEIGFASEARRFTAHLTLARFKVPVAVGELPQLGADPGTFEIDRLELYRSHLHPSGARYEVVAAEHLRST